MFGDFSLILSRRFVQIEIHTLKSAKICVSSVQICEK